MRRLLAGVVTGLMVVGLLVAVPGAAGAAGGTPALYGCGGGAHRRPATFQLACGDGNGYFDRATWRRWGTSGAGGSARQWYNTCRPSCAAGNYVKRRVAVTLYRVAVRGGKRYFSRIKVGGAHGYVTSTPRPPRAATSTPVKTYANCTALRRVYRHGVGRAGARESEGRRDWTVNTAVYNANRKSDRDRDGVACEG